MGTESSNTYECPVLGSGGRNYGDIGHVDDLCFWQVWILRFHNELVKSIRLYFQAPRRNWCGFRTLRRSGIHCRDFAFKNKGESRWVPQYLSRSFPNHWLGILTQLSVVFGILITQAIGINCATSTSWRFVLVASSGVGIGQLLFSPFIVESPVWLHRQQFIEIFNSTTRKLWGKTPHVKPDGASRWTLPFPLESICFSHHNGC
jgi:hypothetical protein